MPVLNAFRLSVILAVAVLCLYKTENPKPKSKSLFRRAAISHWPSLTFPLPLLPGWTDLVDPNVVPNLAVRKTASDVCETSDPGCTWSCFGCVADDVTTCPDKNTLALSFDDGPSPVTPGLLDVLDANNMKVTFFIVGSQLLADANKATLLRAFKAGHQIASHTWSHRALTTLTNEQIIAEIMWTHEIISSVIGVGPTYVRPPYGDVDNRVRAIIKKLGYRVTIWSHDTNDWKIPDKKPSEIADDFGRWINDQTRTKGIISLEHDLYAEAVGAFTGALNVINASNMNMMTIAQCQGNNPYTDGTVAGNGTVPTGAGSVNGNQTIEPVPVIIAKDKPAAAGTNNDIPARPAMTPKSPASAPFNPLMGSAGTREVLSGNKGYLVLVGLWVLLVF